MITELCRSDIVKSDFLINISGCKQLYRHCAGGVVGEDLNETKCSVLTSEGSTPTTWFLSRFSIKICIYARIGFNL